MRRRYQAGSVSLSGDGRYWVGKYRDENKRHKCKLLGKAREMTKSQAREVLAGILRPVNAVVEGVGPTVNQFLEGTYFPLFSRKWKGSTLGTNRDRITREIGGALGDRVLAQLTREELQRFLDSKGELSHGTVSHLRWDLKQIFDVAMSEGMVARNPALMLFVPASCTKAERPVMNLAEVKVAIVGLGLRERLVFKLATVAGLRPGEIFGLRRRRVLDQVVGIQERVYRGEVGPPKTARSVRSVSLAATLREDVGEWLETSCPDIGPEAWLFPSERLVTPMSQDNFMYRFMRPALSKMELGWVSFQVMRRTYASLMRELGVDPKIVADLMGHDVKVNLNVYTQTSTAARLEAAETLASAIDKTNAVEVR